MKEKTKQKLTFVKQYPNIIRDLFGSRITLVKHKDDTDLGLLSIVLNDIINR